MKSYLVISGAIFGIVALLHAARLVLDWPVQLAGWSVPMWASGIGLLVAGALCIWAFQLAWGSRSPA